jgi:pilus assembly protein TadC
MEQERFAGGNLPEAIRKINHKGHKEAPWMLCRIERVWALPKN